jgi:hypothetical protein
MPKHRIFSTKFSKVYPMQRIRYLDKLVDELAKGMAMHKILRQ